MNGIYVKIRSISLEFYYDKGINTAQAHKNMCSLYGY